MPWIGGTLEPVEVAALRCPRCWFAGPFRPFAPVTFRCLRCEWPFTLAAPTVASPAVPLTTVPVTNSTGTVVAVTITGGTLTSVVVNGVQAGTTAATYLIPVAATISVTFCRGADVGVGAARDLRRGVRERRRDPVHRRGHVVRAGSGADHRPRRNP